MLLDVFCTTLELQLLGRLKVLKNVHLQLQINIFQLRYYYSSTLWPLLFRMLFIRSSLQTEIQAVYSRKKFFYQIIFIPQGLILVHFVLNYQLFLEENYRKAPIMLVKACIDPFQEFHVPLYNIFRSDQFLLAVYNYVCFHGNLSLFRWDDFIHFGLVSLVSSSNLLYSYSYTNSFIYLYLQN